VSGFRVAAHASRPPLALVNISDLHSHLEIWELAADGTPSFVRQRTLQIDPEQAGWGASRALDVACLPGDRLAIGLYYADPRTRHALFIYDITANAFHKIGDAVPANGSGPLFEVRPVGGDSAMVLWHAGEVRVQAEVYVHDHVHLMLVSPRHPQGLEVLALGLDDGNVERWALVGHTLWLDAIDARDMAKPAKFVWSLDLARVL
jgi:hypothetical protein